MILKKPYAFLIRHFRLIHFLLFLVAGYLLITSNGLYNYTNTFVKTLVYSTPINTVLNDMMFTSFWVLMVGFGTITYLLYYKKKPFIEYVIGIGIYILIYVLFVIVNKYFNDLGVLPDVKTIRALKDFLLMAYLIQYVIVFYLLIKFMGLDLKKFGFKEDKDILEEEADAEEVEVALEFDKDKYIRLVKKRIRFLKYYLIEYKRIFIPIGCVLIAILGLVIFLNHETTRDYKMGESFTGNAFQVTVNRAYFTDRNYDGSKIYSKGTRKYLIVNIDLTNFSSESRRFDLENFSLITDSSLYHNTYAMYSYFEDLGSRYNDNYLEPKTVFNYILLFEIESMDFGKDFYLTYKTGGFRSATRKVKLIVTDLTNYVNYLTVKKGESMKLLFYNGKDVDYKIINYSFNDSVSYFYDGCKSPSSCGTYSKTTDALNNRKILNIKYISQDIDGYDFTNILSKHGILIYKIGDEEKSTKLIPAVQIKYKGDFLYYSVPEEIEKANYLELKIVIRDKEYHYIIKDEGEEI